MTRVGVLALRSTYGSTSGNKILPFGSISASGASAVGRLGEVRVGSRTVPPRRRPACRRGSSDRVVPRLPARAPARARVRPRAPARAARAMGASPKREEARRVELRTHTRNNDSGETREI
eukprot:31238-Pelagococcus_subviridis.AAC.5